MTSRYHGPIIDAHHHLWDLSLGRHPWITSADSAIKALGDIGYLRRDYLVADYLADIGHEPVEGSVYVEGAWDRTRPPLEEIAWLEGLARPRQIAARSIAWAPLKSQNAPAVLDGLAARPSVVGIREVVRWHPDPAKRWTEAGLLDDPQWRRGFGALKSRGLLLCPAELRGQGFGDRRGCLYQSIRLCHSGAKAGAKTSNSAQRCHGRDPAALRPRIPRRCP